MAGLRAGEVDGRVGRGSYLAAAARPKSHDDYCQWHLSWLCDTVTQNNPITDD